MAETTIELWDGEEWKPLTGVKSVTFDAAGITPAADKETDACLTASCIDRCDCLEAAAVPEVFELDIPLIQGRPPLTANLRLSWRPERQRKIFIRDAVQWQARKIGAATRITVGLHYRPGDKRRRDASNLMPTQKPAVDALVRAGVVPDDTAEFVTEQMPALVDGPAPRRLWLRVEVTAR